VFAQNPTTPLGKLFASKRSRKKLLRLFLSSGCTVTVYSIPRVMSVPRNIKISIQPEGAEIVKRRK
jgi:hypothetical protein